MRKPSHRPLIVIAFGLLAFGTIGLLLFPIIKSSRMHWPKIRDYDLLFSEAKAMSQRKTDGFVNGAEWPPSFRQLLPRSVYVEADFVEIVVSTGGINAGWGFYIYTGATLDPQRVRNPTLKPTVHPRIYRCTEIE